MPKTVSGHRARAILRTFRRPAHRYAAQRRLGYNWLRFVPTLEEEFLGMAAKSARRRIRGAALLTFIGITLMTVIDLMIGASEHGAGVMTYVFGVAVVAAALFAATFLRIPGRRLQTITHALLLVFVVLVALAQTNADVPLGVSGQMGIALTLLIVYFASGLTLYRAFSVSVVLIATYQIGLLMRGYSHQFWVELAIATLTNAFGIMGAYRVEYEARGSFLLRRELEGLALADGLTGLLNRRAFYRRLQRLWGQAARENASLGLLLLDVDRFKQINDQFGHSVGDHCLRVVAKVLKGLQRRPLDASGRLGGDEFAGIWYGVDQHWFQDLIQRIPERMANADAAEGATRVTVSVGAVCIKPGARISAFDALRAADRNLYKVKLANRNGALCTILEGPSPASDTEREDLGETLAVSA